MTLIKNSIDSLTRIPLLSLSIVGLSFPSVTVAMTVAPKNIQAPEAQLVAQRTTCEVANIQTGQLALRFTPNGKSRAGLNNGNTVALLREGSNPWVYVRVTEGPTRVNGLEGWVNSNYLNCGLAGSEDPTAGACEVVNIQTGQLALRYTPNGRTRAGLDNGNLVMPLQVGESPWMYVRVVRGPNSRVNGLEGWVNAGYLACD